MKIGCVLDAEEAKYGLKLQTDVAITTPEFLGKLIRDGDVVPPALRVVTFDEADLALERTAGSDLNSLFVGPDEGGEGIQPSHVPRGGPA